jgi:hypothetical protein
MNAPVPEATDDNSASALSDEASETRLQNLPAHSEQNVRPKIEIDAEKIRSSVARLTSSSIEELEGLAGELQKLDDFLKLETGRVQREIESVLAGIKIIIETIAPWKRPSAASGSSSMRNFALGTRPREDARRMPA